MKVLFLDLDGTVRLSTSGGIFIEQPENQKIIDGVKEAIADTLLAKMQSRVHQQQ